MNKFFKLILAVCLVFSISCGKKSEKQDKIEEKLKIAFIYVGPVGDAGWTFAHDQGRKQIQKEFPEVETVYMESVPEGADAERVLAQFAERGFRLIFATSFGYMDPVIKVAEKYPDVIFMHCSGYKRAKNVGTYFGKMEQAKYLSGIIAGKQTKTGKIGYVAPHPIPEVIRFINAFALGVRFANPEATVHIVWTNSWFDPGREKEAANSLMDAGCDILSTGADSAAPLQAAQERGMLAFGYDSDNRHYAPDAFLTAPVWDWAVIYRHIVKQVLDGAWKSEDYWWDLNSELVKLAPFSALVTEQSRTLTEAQTLEIKNGTKEIFAGPLYRQDGTLVCAMGSKLTDKELLSMDYFLQGVEGAIPR